MSSLTQLSGINIAGNDRDILMYSGNKWINTQLNNILYSEYLISSIDVNGISIADTSINSTQFFNLQALSSNGTVPFIIKLPLNPTIVRVINLTITYNSFIIVLIAQSNAIFTTSSSDTQLSYELNSGTTNAIRIMYGAPSVYNGNVYYAQYNTTPNQNKNINITIYYDDSTSKYMFSDTTMIYTILDPNTNIPIGVAVN